MAAAAATAAAIAPALNSPAASFFASSSLPAAFGSSAYAEIDANGNKSPRNNGI